MINLDNRLKSIYDAVRSNKKVIDVGCDHGYLAAKLLLDKKSPFCVCTDINIKCLEKARHLAAEHGLLEKMQFFLTDGLKEIDENLCEDIVIAGMGSDLITNIVDRCSWLKQKNDKHLILQPMLKPWVLREYLCQNGFKITRESLTCAHDFFYITIEAKFSGEKISVSPIDKYIGLLFENPNQETKKYFSFLSEKFIRISNNVSRGGDIQKSDYYKEIALKIQALMKSL